ncbi:hypothetical protein NHQ30_009921 [Ciborinia camelliae]|nr:hypothetical protein NHQ30_009921 [Ciborinia camelliae]
MDGVDENFQIFIKHKVCERSEGLFLYARLMLDQIEQSIKGKNHNEASIREMLAKLSVGLEEMYNRLLSDHASITNIHQDTQVLILQLVTQSARPMRLIKIAKAIEANPYLLSSGRESKDIVRSGCGPLLEIMEDGVVQILHHSFTEFLLDVGRTARATSSLPQFSAIDPKEAHREIVLICPSQLQGGAFDTYPITDDTEDGGSKASRAIGGPSNRQEFDFLQSFVQYPLLEYAAMKWTYHAKRYDCEDLDFYETLEEFCKSHNQAFKAWSKWIGVDGGATDINHRLRQRGHTEIVKRLLDIGAEPNVDGVDGTKPLHITGTKNHAGIVKLLLGAGVSSLTPKTGLSNGDHHPLMHVGTLIEMIPCCEIGELEMALILSTRLGHHVLLSTLLDKTNVSPNAKARVEGTTALIQATNSLKPKSVQILLEKGAIANMRSASADDLSPADYSARLLRYGTGSKILPAGTPLHTLAMVTPLKKKKAAAKEILNMLLAAGADLEARDANGDTLLLLTLSSSSGEFDQTAIELLLSAGADPHPKKSSIFARTFPQGKTALHLACHSEYAHEILKIFLIHGADLNWTDNMNNNTLLHESAALFYGDPEDIALVEYLVQNGVSASAKNHRQQTAAHIMGPVHTFCIDKTAEADRDTFISVIRRLCTEFDVNSKDMEGYTPLHYACSTSELSSFVLMKAGADLNAKAFNQRTPLHCAARGRQCGIISMLLNQAQETASTINLNAQDSKGLTPLH